MAIFLIILLLFFTPIPLIIKIHYSSNLYYIKIFNFTIISSSNEGVRKLISKINKKKNLKDASKKKKTKKRKLSIINLYRFINNNKFKPKISIKGDLFYSFDDAAITAISYGLLCNVQYLVAYLTEKIFNVKYNIFNINPKFNGENLFNFTISSIIYFNIAQIIYILYLIYKSFEKIEEVSP